MADSYCLPPNPWNKMISKISNLLIILALLLFPLEASASTEPFNSGEQFATWLTHYYLHPEPERTTRAIEFISTTKDFRNSIAITAVFFSTILKEDKNLLKTTYDQISKANNQKTRYILLNILGVLKTPESKELLQKAQKEWDPKIYGEFIKKRFEVPALDLENMPVRSVLDLEMLWAIFFVTGKDWPVKRVISTLDKKVADPKLKVSVSVGADAETSLHIHIKNHPRVCEIVKSELKKSSKNIKPLLDPIVAECDEKAKLPAKS